MQSLYRNFGFAVLFLAVGVYAVVALRGPNGLSALAEKRRIVQVMQEQNASLAADNVRKRERIHLLGTSREAQDLEIRGRLKLLRPNETQFILPDSPKTDR